MIMLVDEYSPRFYNKKKLLYIATVYRGLLAKCCRHTENKTDNGT